MKIIYRSDDGKTEWSPREDGVNIKFGADTDYGDSYTIPWNQVKEFAEVLDKLFKDSGRY